MLSVEKSWHCVFVPGHTGSHETQILHIVVLARLIVNMTHGNNRNILSDRCQSYHQILFKCKQCS